MVELPMRSPVAPVLFPDAERAGAYLAAGLWTSETLADFVAERTMRFADRTALVARDCHGVQHHLTYADLGERSHLAAARLRTVGVRPGDRVILALGNQVEFVELLFGLFALGALPVFALPSHQERELSQFAHVADAALIVLGGPGAEDLHARTARALASLPGPVLPPALLRVEDWADVLAPADTIAQQTDAGQDTGHRGVPADQVAFLQLSGGTTGVSKLIPRTPRDYLYSVRASAEICQLTAHDTLLVTIPVGHNFALSSPGVLGFWHVGGTVVLASDPSPGTAFGLIATERVTHAPLVPPLLQAWLQAARRRAPDLSSLRVVQVGGAKLSSIVAAEVAPVLGAELQQVFGMAEGLVCYTRPGDSVELVERSQGRPISSFDEIRVVDPDDPDEAEVAPGQEGALLTRGPYTISSYYRLESRQSEHFTADGFYRTGDLVRRLPSGHLVVTGRAKDQINRGGEKVATQEIEDVLLAHPAVFDAVALGVPDRHLGERVVAVVVPETGLVPSTALARDLTAFLLASGLAAWKVPEQIHAVSAFPVTGVGKNSRRALRSHLAAQWTNPKEN